MSPRAGPPRLSTPCFPRVSGDEPVNDAGYAAETAFSPRERG